MIGWRSFRRTSKFPNMLRARGVDILGTAINEVLPEKGSLGEEVSLGQPLTYSLLQRGPSGDDIPETNKIVAMWVGTRRHDN